MVKNSQKMTKNDQKNENFEKKIEIFFAQNRFRINQKAFFVKISVLKFFQKMVKNDEKWSKMNIFEKKIFDFFFKSIQNVSKRILNRKS